MITSVVKCGRIELNDEDGEFALAHGTGDRSIWKRIIFDEAFAGAPSVITSLAGIDAGNAANLRIISVPHSVTMHGFDLEIRTWADTRIFYVCVSWMATGL